jgi:hypothetical protein
MVIIDDRSYRVQGSAPDLTEDECESSCMSVSSPKVLSHSCVFGDPQPDGQDAGGMDQEELLPDDGGLERFTGDRKSFGTWSPSEESRLYSCI